MQGDITRGVFTFRESRQLLLLEEACFLLELSACLFNLPKKLFYPRVVYVGRS